MEKSYRELYSILKGINLLKDINASGKFVVCLNRNRNKLKDILIPVEEGFLQLSKEEKIEFNNMIKERDSAISKDEEKNKELILHLEEKYSNLLNKMEEIEKHNNEILDTETDIEFIKISDEFIPDMNLSQIETIQDLIL